MAKIEDLIDWFKNKNQALIAVSGGVDSALVAYAAYQQLKGSAIAVTADYKTLAQDELNTSKQVCHEIGIRQILVNYNELENANFVRNDQNRCYHCRSELSFHLIKIAKEFGIKVIVDGTNLDDLGDFRPGITALRENGIKSPLVETGFTKNDVRREARAAKLSIYDRPSNSCLASRIPWGSPVTAEKLQRIEIAENIVKQLTKVKQIRVRDFEGHAKIEVGKNEMKLLEDETKLEKIKSKLKFLGFVSIFVDPEGYRPGKINVISD